MQADLKRTYVYLGKAYGPGADVEIPEGLAATLGLGESQPASDDAPASEQSAGDTQPPALSLVTEPPVSQPPVTEPPAAGDTQPPVVP